MTHTVITIHHDDGDETRLEGTGYAVRCAAHIAHENLPDARWALKVLNRYGHLVPHEADAIFGDVTRVHAPTTDSSLADQMRTLACDLPAVTAMRLGMLAVEVERIEAALDEMVQNAREDAAIVAADARVVPISCGISRRFQ